MAIGTNEPRTIVDSPDELRERQAIVERFRAVRRRSEALCRHLPAEDLTIQSMPDASPLKWHLAHTTWFFETFLLKPWNPSLSSACERSEYLFNSYYESVGDQFPRSKRGLLSRPTAEEVFAYRAAVDEAVSEAFDRFVAGSLPDGRAFAETLEIGLQHEQQHQELMLTDVKHLLSQHPLYPSYRTSDLVPALDALSTRVTPEQNGRDRSLGAEDSCARPAGLAWVGRDAGDGFCFDNETPRHAVYLQSHRIATRLITNGEYLAFVEDGGYRRPEFWLSLGWATVQECRWTSPFYWVDRDGERLEFSLDGLRPLDLAAPVAHVSYFEADAFARWSGARLPTEAEWETAVADRAPNDACGYVESGALAPTSEGVGDWFGQVWQWTSSSYGPHPGYRPWPGAVGEYNGKFMCNQYVLRGGSCATPMGHVRATYRNFFPPDARWQFSGLRLAWDE